MEKFDKYFDKAKDLAGDAGGKAKNIAGDVLGVAKERVQGFMQSNAAAKEIKAGVAQLEALPEVEGSILYTMELQSAFSYLRNLLFVIGDGRLDDASVAEEIKRVIEKVQPAADAQTAEGDVQEEVSDEEQASENIKAIVYSACTKALETFAAV